MFSKIQNISIIYDNSKKYISRIYELVEPKYMDKIRILNQYFISDLVKKVQESDTSISGTIIFKSSKITYSHQNNLIVNIYSELDDDNDDLSFVETAELLALQLTNKFGKLFDNASKFMEYFDVSARDIGIEIDNILGLTSIIHYESEDEANMGLLSRFQITSIKTNKIIKQIKKKVDLENNDLFVFQILFEDINGFIKSSRYSNQIKLNYNKIQKELKRYIEMEKWLTSL